MSDLPNNSSIARFLPATLIPDASLNDDKLEMAASCGLDDEHIRCERTEQGTLRIYPPTPVTIWLMIQKFHRELVKSLVRANIPGQSFVRRRFFLDEWSMMCPDVAYITPGADKKLEFLEFGQPLKLCPNFIVEFCSQPRELRRLKDKMLRWMASGAELGWLIVPQEQCVYIYSPSSEPLIFDDEFAVGQGPCEHFVLSLSELWSLDQYRRVY
jgi:Uma2 family endonuclease